jgi:hypothetical protein
MPADFVDIDRRRVNDDGDIVYMIETATGFNLETASYFDISNAVQREVDRRLSVWESILPKLRLVVTAVKGKKLNTLDLIVKFTQRG